MSKQRTEIYILLERELMTIRLTAPHRGREVPCQVYDRRGFVVCEEGGPVPVTLPLDVPLTIRFDARSVGAEIAARELRDKLKRWGYVRVAVERGLTKRLKGVRV